MQEHTGALCGVDVDHQFLDNLHYVLLVGHPCDQLKSSHSDGLIPVLDTVHDDVPGGDTVYVLHDRELMDGATLMTTHLT